MRACEGVCGVCEECVRVCEGMQGDVRGCKGVRVCGGMQGGARGM